MGVDSYFYNTIKEFGVCPRPSDSFIVEGKGSDNVYILFTLKIMPCSRTDGCKSLDEMAKANFQIVLPSSNYDLSSKDDPHRFILNVDDVYYVNPTVKQMFNSKVKQTVVRDSGGVFDDWTERKVVYEIGSTLGTQSYRPTTQLECLAADAKTPDSPSCVSYFEYSL